jgi:hypothetical protein
LALGHNISDMCVYKSGLYTIDRRMPSKFQPLEVKRLDFCNVVVAKIIKKPFYKAILQLLRHHSREYSLPVVMDFKIMEAGRG